MYLFIYLFICLFICLFVYLFIYLFTSRFMAHIQVHQIHDDIRYHVADNNFFRQMFLTGAFEHLLSQYFLLRICVHGLLFSGALNLINAVGIGLYIAFVHLML